MNERRDGNYSLHELYLQVSIAGDRIVSQVKRKQKAWFNLNKRNTHSFPSFVFFIKLNTLRFPSRLPSPSDSLVPEALSNHHPPILDLPPLQMQSHKGSFLLFSLLFLCYNESVNKGKQREQATNEIWVFWHAFVTFTFRFAFLFVRAFFATKLKEQKKQNVPGMRFQGGAGVPFLFCPFSIELNTQSFIFCFNSIGKREQNEQAPAFVSLTSLHYNYKEGIKERRNEG